MRSLHSILFPALLIALVAAGCSDPASPRPAAPFASRQFQPSLNQVQITRIYFDEKANEAEGGTLNEYIVLQAPDTMVLRNWRLKAGDHDLIQIRSDTLPRMLTIYTRSEPGRDAVNTTLLGLDIWLWKDDHDTARLYDQNNQLVSVLGY